MIYGYSMPPFYTHSTPTGCGTLDERFSIDITPLWGVKNVLLEKQIAAWDNLIIWIRIKGIDIMFQRIRDTLKKEKQLIAEVTAETL